MEGLSAQKRPLAQAVAEFKEKFPAWCQNQKHLDRLAEAQDLASSKNYIYRQGDSEKFNVCSNSTMGVIYVVDCAARSCSCPHFVQSLKFGKAVACKHRLAVHLLRRAKVIEFEFLEWSKAFESYQTARGTDQEYDEYQRMCGFDVVAALEAHADAIKEMGARLPQ